ncbi:hypothetical protein V1318_07705 [Lysobacter sp. CCNWLW3]
MNSVAPLLTLPVIPAKAGIAGCGEPQANRIVAIFGARIFSAPGARLCF